MSRLMTLKDMVRLLLGLERCCNMDERKKGDKCVELAEIK